MIDSQHDASLAYLDKFDKIIHKLNSMEVSINNTNNKLGELSERVAKVENLELAIGKLSAMVAKLIDDQK